MIITLKRCLGLEASGMCDRQHGHAIAQSRANSKLYIHAVLRCQRACLILGSKPASLQCLGYQVAPAVIPLVNFSWSFSVSSQHVAL